MTGTDTLDLGKILTVRYANNTEDLKHLILMCPVYSLETAASNHLKKPHNENEDDIAGQFLHKEDIESKKEVLYRIWWKRCTEMKKLLSCQSRYFPKALSQANPQPIAKCSKGKENQIYWRADAKASPPTSHCITLHHRENVDKKLMIVMKKWKPDCQENWKMFNIKNQNVKESSWGGGGGRNSHRTHSSGATHCISCLHWALPRHLKLTKGK